MDKENRKTSSTRGKGLWMLLGGAVTLSLLWSGCAPAATPPLQPTSVPTPRTAAQPTPTPIPQAATPTSPTAPKSTPAPVQPTPTPPPAGEKPRSGGILITSVYADPESWDPHQESGIPIMVTAPVFSGILQYDPLDQSKIIGDLAQRWEASPDGLVYTFHLTPGVKWHDGNPFTSEDALFSLNRIRTPPTGMASPRKGSFAAVDKVETPDKDTLKITLKYPSASFLDVLAMGWTLMVPKRIVEPLGGKKMSYRENIGTGPFKFKEFVSSVSIDFVKNPNYFVSGRPYLDGFRIYIIRDVGATQAAFRTGNVFMTYFTGTGWLASDVEAVKKARPDAAVQKALNLQMPNMGMNTKRKPFDDPRVRKAIFLAIDRQVGNQVVQQNEGRVGGPFPPTSPWALPESDLLQIPGYRQPKDQDLAEAKRLMAEAGYSAGFKTTLTARPEKINQDLSVFLVDQLRKLNIQAEIQTSEVATFLTNVNGRNFDLFEWTQALATDDPDQVFGDFYITKAGRNFESHTIPGFDALFDKQSRTLDPAERKKLVLQMQKMILDDPAKAIVVWQTLFQLFDPWVKNYRVATRGVYNNQKFQDVWLAK